MASFPLKENIVMFMFGLCSHHVPIEVTLHSKPLEG